MANFTLKYIQIYIFTYVDEKPVTLFEQVVSYFPNYKIGDEISFIMTDELDLKKDHEIKDFQIRELRSIIAVDRTNKFPSEHTMYIRVSDSSIENDEDEDQAEESLDIDYLLSRMHPN